MKSEDVASPRDAALYFLEHHQEVFSEAYKVGDTIEVVAAHRRFRIEVIEPIRIGPKALDVRVYEKKKAQWEIWDDFPYCDRQTPGAVSMQALGFLWERLRMK